MSTTIKEKDWWTLFKYMSESKFKQRHNKAVDIEPTEQAGFSYIKVYGTEFIQLNFEDEIGDDLINKVAKWSESRKGIEKISMSASDADVVELKHLLLGRASAFVDYCSKSSNPLAEEALWGIWEVFEINWSKKPFIAPLFYHIWGWLQLELGKKGEIQMPRTQRYERQLKEYCRINNLLIISIDYDSQENVRLLVEEKKNER